MNLAQLVAAVQGHRVLVTDHADEEAAADDLTLEDIYVSVTHGEIIEHYPTDRPYPSCLVFGPSAGGAPIHSVWAYNEVTGWAVLVTVYRPDPERWIDWRQRRSRP